jgi:ATP adenylyltransferase
MRNLYAPWRMEYIEAGPTPGCLFCSAFATPASEHSALRVVTRADGALAMLNKFPYNPGHLMVAPRAHVGSLTDLDDGQLLSLMGLVRRTLGVLRVSLRPEGFNVGVNEGRVAGAGIPDHVHVHVVPRWNGDTNFMPVLGDVKVVGEHLDRTWEKLSAAFAGAAT